MTVNFNKFYVIIATIKGGVLMESSDSLINIIYRIRTDAEDILDIINLGIKPMINLESEEFEVSADKFDKLVLELLKIKENLNKDYVALRRKV